MWKIIDNTNLSYFISKIKAAFVSKTDVVTANVVDIDSTPTANSTNLVTSGGVYSAIPPVPVISTNIISDKASDVKTTSPKAVYTAINPAVESSQPQDGFLPNTFYDLGEITETVTFVLASPTDANIVNHYYWTFDTGSTAPTITWPSGITWNGGSAPTINASKHYEISVLNGVGCFMEV